MFRPKILIIEDEFILHQEYCSMFKDKDVEVSLAYSTTYSEAIENIDREQPDLVLLDIELQSKKSGIDVANYLNTLNIPFIYLTGHHNDLVLSLAKETHPKSFIPKSNVSGELLYANIFMALGENDQSTNMTKGISLPKGQRLEYFPFDQVAFIAADNKQRKNFICYHILTESGKFEPYPLRGSIIGTLKKLPEHFVQISKSCIVNINKISSRKSYNGTVYIGEHLLSVSETFKTNLLSKLDKRYIS